MLNSFYYLQKLVVGGNIDKFLGQVVAEGVTHELSKFFYNLTKNNTQV